MWSGTTVCSLKPSVALSARLWVLAWLGQWTAFLRYTAGVSSCSLAVPRWNRPLHIYRYPLSRPGKRRVLCLP